MDIISQETPKLFCTLPLPKHQIIGGIKAIKAAVNAKIFDGILIGCCMDDPEDKLDDTDIQQIMEATGHPSNVHWCQIPEYIPEIHLLNELIKFCQSRNLDLQKCYAYISFYDEAVICTDPNLKSKLTHHYHCAKRGDNFYFKNILRLDRKWEELCGPFQSWYWHSAGDPYDHNDHSYSVDGLDPISVDIYNEPPSHLDDSCSDNEKSLEDDDIEVLQEIAFSYLKEMNKFELIAFIKSKNQKN